MKNFLRFLALIFITPTLFPQQVHAEIATEGKVKVPGGFVWYSVEGHGDKTPILLIHGGPGGSSCSFTILVNKLSKDRPVIIYDQLGAGKSDHPKDLSLWQVDRFVEELDIVIKTLHFKKVTLLAHSWGSNRQRILKAKRHRCHCIRHICGALSQQQRLDDGHQWTPQTIIAKNPGNFTQTRVGWNNRIRRIPKSIMGLFRQVFIPSPATHYIRLRRKFLESKNLRSYVGKFRVCRNR